jgi:hypothetical protein
VGVFRETDASRLANAFQPSGDVDTVAHQVTVGLLDHVAEMNANAKLDALVRRDARIALDHGALRFDCAAYGVDHAAEFDDAAVAGTFDHSAVMDGDCGIDEIAAKRPEPRQNALFVCSREPAVTDHIRNQYRGNFPGLAHGAPLCCGSA